MAKTVERLSYFKMYVADYLLDTGDLTLAQHGAYCLLMFRYYWQGSLPKADVYRSCRSDADRKEVDAVLEKYFHAVDGKYTHNRIERALGAATAYVEIQSQKGKRSAEVRAQKRSALPKTNGKTNKWGTVHGSFGRCKYCPDDATQMTNEIPHCTKPKHLDFAIARN